MYQLIPSITIPRANFQKLSNPAPMGKFFRLILRGFPGTLNSNNFLYFFTIFKTSIINLPIEYLQIGKDKIDLSMENM